jgi:hypothetical protein
MYAVGPPALAVAAAGEFDRARSCARSHLMRTTREATPLMVNDSLLYCGALAFIEGDIARAGTLLGAARYAGEAGGSMPLFRSPVGAAVYAHYLPLVRESLDPEEARQLRDRGRAMSLEEATAYAFEGLHA